MKNSKTYYVTGFEQSFDRYNSACTFARENGLNRNSVTSVVNNNVNKEEVNNMDSNEIITSNSVIETAIATLPVIESSDAPLETEIPTEAITPPPVFRLVLGKKVRAGFETVLMAELAKGPGTTVELVDRMLASGEFHRVAPMAATKRPFKPTNYLLRQWLTAGLVTTTPEPEVIESTETALATA